MQFVLSLNGLQFMSLLPFMHHLFRVAMAPEIPAHSEYSLVIMANCNCSNAWKKKSNYTKNANCFYVIIAVKFCMMLVYALSNFVMILLHIAKLKRIILESFISTLFKVKAAKSVSIFSQYPFNQTIIQPAPYCQIFQQLPKAHNIRRRSVYNGSQLWLLTD